MKCQFYDKTQELVMDESSAILVGKRVCEVCNPKMPVSGEVETKPCWCLFCGDTKIISVFRENQINPKESGYRAYFCYCLVDWWRREEINKIKKNKKLTEEKKANKISKIESGLQKYGKWDSESGKYVTYPTWYDLPPELQNMCWQQREALAMRKRYVWVEELLLEQRIKRSEKKILTPVEIKNRVRKQIDAYNQKMEEEGVDTI